MSTPPVGQIDHIVLAAPDLDRACTEFDATTGVRPVFGGAHPGRGTHNALVAFDAASYLEIIAPDPAQPSVGMAVELTSLNRPTLFHWAVRCSGLANVADRLKTIGWTPTEVRRMTRTPPHGVRLEWELFGLRDHPHGGLVPFFIDWLNCPHPAATSPRVGRLSSLRLTLRVPDQLQALIAELGIDVAVNSGEPRIALTFISPRGEIEYSSAAPKGFRLGG